MNRDELAGRFERDRDHLRGVAYRMLGSLDETGDALQRTWLRAEAADLSDVVNLTGWLTTVTARVCLDMLRARRHRPERPLPPDFESSPRAGAQRGPEDEAVLAESVGLAFLVVLDRLSPAQRVAFVLHDLFAVPFEDIAGVLDRSVPATKKLASRARGRVRGPSPVDASRLAEHRGVTEAFLAASQGGDLDRLLELLAPGVVRRADSFAVPPGTPAEVRGAQAVAEETKVFAARARLARVALIDGRPGIVVAPLGRLLAVLVVRIESGRITEVDVVADPAQLQGLAIGLGDD